MDDCATQMGHQQAAPSSHDTPSSSSSRSRADVDLLSMLGLQKGVPGVDQTSGGGGGGGGGGFGMPSGTGGGGGGQQFAFHEPQPGARRSRASNGGVGGMALDPRARVPVGRAAGRVGGGRVGGSPGTPMTAEEMERIVNGN